MSTTEDELVDALRAGDERAFVDLVDRYSPAMLSVARTHVASREVAEDVVQDTWPALLKGIDGFEFLTAEVSAPIGMTRRNTRFRSRLCPQAVGSYRSRRPHDTHHRNRTVRGVVSR